ncbi:hypothetical protein [Rhizobium leguminosarum]|uniref:hypothetical protein n=1 Tax=Rhizobium leguminosarum TaxID=384 RepID=UPI001C913CD0|nr:hypothetical protein [Rhizobium leguminosarum]MBY2915387.1 hypothetical protein [Rhizobium leguminosarum]MBY2970925.1 hypothetical protein [Rhizobium leguminosarum]MBY2977992.1 hypothetical protein [Rhizobium leguminosarum]MBY3006542.1 hypothetical protein [Rhizobium leguminosarum]
MNDIGGNNALQLKAMRNLVAILVLGFVLASLSLLLSHQATGHDPNQIFVKYGCLPRDGLPAMRRTDLGLETCR